RHGDPCLIVKSCPECNLKTLVPQGRGFVIIYRPDPNLLRSPGKMSKSSSFCAIESLEPRQLLAGTPTAKFSATVFYFNDIQASASGGAGASPSQGLKISNTGTASLTIPSNGITLGGSNGS